MVFAHGIEGGFPGDDERVKRVLDVAAAIEGGQHPGVQRMLSAMEAMPFGGRTALMNLIAVSKMRDDIVTDLFDSCFVAQADTEDEVDDDFMLVSCGCTSRLNTQRVYVLKLLCMVIPRCGALGVSLYKKYCSSTSTTFRSTLLTGMVRCKEFSDADLLEAFEGTVEAGKKTIIDICKETQHRKQFIETLVSKGYAPVATLFSCSSSVVKANLTKMLPGGLTNFKEHIAVYLEYLEQRFRACGNDKLMMGRELREFEKHIPNIRETEHIMALIDLVVKYAPMEITETRSFVREHLESIAKQGKLDDKYEGVKRAYPERFVPLLKKPESIVMNLLSVTPEGAVFKQDYKWLCDTLVSRSKPVLLLDAIKTCLANLGHKDFWNILMNGKEQSAVRDTYKVITTQLCWQTRHNRVTRELLDTFIALHLKHAPHTVTDKQGFSDEDVWRLLISSLTSPFVQVAGRAAKTGSTKLNTWSKTGNRTGITSYYGYAYVLLERLVDKCLQVSEQHIPDSLYISILGNVLKVVIPHISSEDCPVVNKIVEYIVGLLCSKVIPKLGQTIDFDHSSKHYVTNAKLQTFWEWCNDICVPMLARSEKLRDAFLGLMNETHRKATLSEDYLARKFVECVAKDSGRVSYVQLDNNLYSSTCAKALVKILTVASAAEKAKDSAVERKAWCLWKSFVLDVKVRHGGEWKQVKDVIILEQGQPYTSYVTACFGLSKALLEDEKPMLVAIGKHAMQRKAFQSVDTDFKKLGLTMDVLDACDLDDATRTKWILQSQNVGNTQVREDLQKQTTGGDMHVRMAAHVNLLERSRQTNLQETVTSLKYVSERIKNEAGLTRPQVYEWISRNTSWLVTESIGASEHIEVITHALDKMLRDDVSKRDTVAKNHFVRISRDIITAALNYDQMQPKLAERKQWIVAAMKMQWLVTKTIAGEEGWKLYNWDLSTTYPHTNWLPEADLEGVLKPFIHGQCRPYDYDLLRAKVYSEKLYKSNDEAYLTPADAVSLLVTALDEVRDEHFKLNKENTWLQSRSLDPTTPEGFTRVLSLLRYAGARWTEVPCLIDAFNEVIKALKDLPSFHLGNCLNLTNTVLGLYSSPMWYELPILREACEAMMEVVVAHQYRVHLNAVRALWTTAELGQGVVNFDKLNALQKNFILAKCPTLKKKAKTVAEAEADKNALAVRTVVLSRKLLGYCKSFVFCPDVAKCLISKRDDLLGDYIGKPQGELSGLFHEVKAGVSKTPFNFGMTPTDLASTTGAIACKYSTVSLQFGMMRSNNTSVRSEAIVNYVKSPTTSHTDVIALLKDLTARSAGTDGSEADDSLNHIIESVILSIFSTDAVWFILAYLLSPQVIASSPHRTTATILTNLTNWAPTHKVVGISGLLLNGSRRSSLSMFLHKQILRMLCEAGTAEAAELFISEWRQRVERKDKEDTVKEMVKLALSHLIKDSHLNKAAWEVASDIAKDPACVPDTTALLLLTVSWSSVNPCDVSLSPCFRLPHEAVPAPTEEVPERKRVFLKLCKALSEEVQHSFTDAETRDRFYALMQEFEKNVANDMLQVLVRVKKYTFSKPSVELLEELQGHLTASGLREGEGGLTSPEFFTVERLGMMYSTAVSGVLRQVMETEKYTQVQKGQGVAIEEECKVNPYALHMRAFLGVLYNKLLDTSPRDVVTVRHVACVVVGIKSVMQSQPGFRHIVAPHETAVSTIKESGGHFARV